MVDDLSRFMNALALLGISALLAFAFVDQIVFADLPCPLCLLQRLGFALAGFGFALNLTAGSRPLHYAFVILGSMAGATAAARQVLLHIVPGSGAYGQPLFGLHFYSWAFIAFVLILVWCALLLIVEHRRLPWESGSGAAQATGAGDAPRAPIVAIPVVVFALLIGLNAISTVLECAAGICPADPTHYQLLR